MRYFVPEIRANSVDFTEMDDAGVGLFEGLRRVLAYAATVGDPNIMKAFDLAFSCARSNKPFSPQDCKIVLSEDHRTMLTELRDTADHALSLMDVVGELEEAWAAEELGNRSLWLLQQLGESFIVTEPIRCAVRIQEVAIPQDIARSFHPDHRTPLPESFFAWLTEGDENTSRGQLGMTLIGDVACGHDIVRLDGAFELTYKRAEAGTDEEGLRALAFLCHKMFDKGLDIGCPDDELRALLDPFIS